MEIRPPRDPRRDGRFWQSEHYFRLLVENAKDHAIFSLDLDGRITTWNAGAERLLGWSKDEAIGQPTEIVFMEEDRTAGVPEKEMARAAANGRAEDTRWHVRKGGERFWANGVMEAVRSEAGELIGFAKIFRDLTREKKYEEALEQSNQRLYAFASQVAHEMRSPLTGIRTLLQLMQKRTGGALDDDTLDMANHVQEAIGDLDRFANDLLAYARLNGRDGLERERTESATALDDALADLRLQIEERGAEIQVGDLPEVFANPTLLRHLFRNLISNAIEHNDADVPRIRIGAEERDDAWCMYVEDNGPGIGKADQGELFSLFRQSNSNGRSGLGVGLALCKGIAEHHEGRIWVEAQQGRGSTFLFTLPKPPAAPAQ